MTAHAKSFPTETDDALLNPLIVTGLTAVVPAPLRSLPQHRTPPFDNNAHVLTVPVEIIVGPGDARDCRQGSSSIVDPLPSCP